VSKEIRYLTFACLLLLAQASGLFAQQQNSDQTQLIQSLMMRIDQLEKRVAELESPKPQGAAAPANAVPQAAEAMQMVT